MPLCHKLLFRNLLFLMVIFTCPANARDYAGPYRPYSAELDHGGGGEFKGWDEAAFSKLSIEDARLKRAYAAMLGSSAGYELHFREPEWTAALADMRRRGDTVTPMLLKLMTENEETGFESNVLVGISYVRTINVEPYLEYARRVFHERTQTMSAALAGCAAHLFAVSGTKEDGELLKWVMKTRPYVADSVTRELDSLNRRLNLPKQEPRPPLKGTPATSEPPAGNSRSKEQKVADGSHRNGQHTNRWIALALAFLVVCGFLRKMLKARK